MKCDEIEVLLSAYVDLEVTDKEKTLVEDHLKVCEACRRTVSEFTGMHGLYQDVAVKEPLPGFRQRVTQRLEKKSRHGFPGLSWSLPKLAYVLPFALLMLVVGIISLQVTEQPSLVVVDVYAEDYLFDQAGSDVEGLFALEETIIADEIMDMFFVDEADNSSFFSDELSSQNSVSRFLKESL
jgi:predicted anti-sigma-YlaC factor YlaD